VYDSALAAPVTQVMVVRVLVLIAQSTPSTKT